MADSPFSVSSGKPTISRVPEQGGGAFRPRPVFSPATPKARPPRVPEGEVEASAPSEGGAEMLADGEAAPVALDALWARLAAVEARRKGLKVRSGAWAQEGMKSDG